MIRTQQLNSKNVINLVQIQRYQKMLNNKSTSQTGQQKRVINGRWTKTQNDRFMKGLEKYGRDWVLVQKIVKTRTLSQVRSHAQKVFLKMKDEDVQALIQGESYSEEEFQQCRRKGKSRVEGSQRRNRGQVATTTIYQSDKTFQHRQKEDLLQLFKRAIQHETLQLQSQSQIQTQCREVQQQTPAIHNEQQQSCSSSCSYSSSSLQPESSQEICNNGNRNDTRMNQMQFVGTEFKPVQIMEMF